MFFFGTRKKELDITDALKRKEATITIGGEPVVIRAFKLPQALALLASLQHIQKMLSIAAEDMAQFNREMLAKLPEILAFCVPEKKIDPEKVTLTEFADLLLAVWCVNDLDRILSNFFTGDYVNAKTNAGYGGISKAINDYFGVKIEDLSPTQINAYVLEIAKDIKAQKEAAKKGKTVSNSLQSLKNFGFKIKGKK